jgi:hypothetical protein
VHGYSLLRTTLNQEYFHDLYDKSLEFGIEIEGHREFYYILHQFGFDTTLFPVQIPKLDQVRSPYYVHSVQILTSTGIIGVFETALVCHL